MARRKQRQGAAEDIMGLVARLPWWAGVLLAVVFYLLLHAVAERPVPLVTQSGQAGDVAVRTMVKTFATVGQYALPFLCLVGALLSFVRQRKRRLLAAQAATADTATEALHGLSWQQFEQLVGEGFRQQGYQVEETGQAGPDGGVDLALRRDGELHLVQCKQWRAQRVGVDVVRSLYGVMAARGAASGIVVSAGRFTTEAERFAEGRNLRLITGQQLHQLLQASSPRPAVIAGPPDLPTAPACPSCAQAMVLRTAKRGAQPGQRFWGCTGYPSCRGTRPLTSEQS